MVSFLKGIRSPSRHGWRSLLEENIAAIDSPTPEFKVEIGAVDSYDRMFTGDFSAKWTEDQLLDHVLASGRLLLAGRGGGAKTVILGKCAKRALRRKYVPILLSMRSWTQMNAQTWSGLGSRSMKICLLYTSRCV